MTPRLTSITFSGDLGRPWVPTALSIDMPAKGVAAALVEKALVAGPHEGSS